MSDPLRFKAGIRQSFPDAAKVLLEDSQMRQNVRHATTVIRTKRDLLVAETPDWQELREAGSEIKRRALAHLDSYLVQFERACIAAGGVVHWASDGGEANRIAIAILASCGAKDVIKVKSMTTEEIGSNAALAKAGITPHETDLAELIIQLGNDKPSHIVVPALHKNREQIRRLFMQEMNLQTLGDTPEDLTQAARSYLRQKFLTIPYAITGANFLVAETGSVVVVESEGNGRMCVTLPRVLICLAGIEKVIPKYRDLEVFLQTLPRSATGERMNPYNSIWTGTTDGDGPQEFHVILLDNSRSEILRDAEAQQTLKCIRCGACQNVCPVYRQTGGHAYQAVYSGPIGAILTPQLAESGKSDSLPYASSLCGACFEVCPVKINIPEVLIHLRGRIVRKDQQTLARKLSPWNLGMQMAAAAFANGDRLKLSQILGRLGQAPFVDSTGYIKHLPFALSGWTESRDLAAMPNESFRTWWSRRQENSPPAVGDRA